MGDLKPYQETTDVQQQNFTNIGRLERGEKNTNKQKYTTDSLIKERNEPSTNAPSSSPVTKKMLLSL